MDILELPYPGGEDETADSPLFTVVVCGNLRASWPGGRGAMAHPRIQIVGFFGNFKVSSESH